MKKEYEKNPEKHESEQPRENEENDLLYQILKALVGICFLPLAIGYLVIPRYASSTKIWRIKEITFKLVVSAIVLLPAQYLLLKFTFHFLLQREWVVGVVMIVLNWISLILNITYRTRWFFLFEYLFLIVRIRHSLAIFIILILFQLHSL